MKILNAYAGVGGNRRLWGDKHEITAVEWNVFGCEEWNEDEQQWEEWYDEDGCNIDGNL